MNTNHVQFLLPGYLDGEIDLVNAIAIEEHLKDCAICLRQYQELSALRSAVHDAHLLSPAPRGLEKRIHSSLRKANNVPWTAQLGRWAWAPAAALILFLAVLTLGIRGQWFLPVQSPDLAQEIQSAHVRSMMANHLTDVTSTDQHTVKPWFDGKLDFAPPVTDLAMHGFPLIGGRLDYLENHPAAALVYQRNKHIINLFIWPTTNRSSLPKSSTDNGYNLIFWSHAGMSYSAVSDLNQADLQTFVELFQKATQ